MKILVCGAGDVGWHAVERLLRLGEHELAVLDTDRNRLENLANQFDVSYFVGSCTLPSSYAVSYTHLTLPTNREV